MNRHYYSLKEARYGTAEIDGLAKKYGMYRSGDRWALKLETRDVARVLTLHPAVWMPAGMEYLVNDVLRGTAGRIDFTNQMHVDFLHDWVADMVDSAPGYDEDDFVALLTPQNAQIYEEWGGNIVDVITECAMWYVDDEIGYELRDTFRALLSDSIAFALGHSTDELSSYKFQGQTVEVLFNNEQANDVLEVLENGNYTYSDKLKDKKLYNLYGAMEAFELSDRYAEIVPWELSMSDVVEDCVKEGLSGIDKDDLNKAFEKVVQEYAFFRESLRRTRSR